MDGEKVRYVVIGAGHIAQAAILPAFAQVENAELVGLISGRQEKREALAERYGLEHVGHYDDLERILRESAADAVYITVPNHLHREYTVRAARAGVHVLCEKPMAVTEEECEEMIQACDEAGVALMIAYRLHFEPANLEAIRQVAEGAVGNPRYFASTFSQDVEEGDVRLAPLEKGGGPLYDLGVYCINAARYLFGDEPIEVRGVQLSSPDPRFGESEENAAAVLVFPGGRTATFTVGFGSVGVNAYDLVGDDGRLRMDPAYDYHVGLGFELVRGEKRAECRFEAVDQFGPEIAYFADCVRERRTPEPDGREGLADIRIIRGIIASARTGRAVKLEPVEPQDRPQPDQARRMEPVEEPELVEVTSPTKD